MKKYIIIISIVVILAGLLIWVFVFKGADESLYEFVVAERQDVIQEVSVTGKVAPSRDADLAFDITGRVTSVYFDIGNFVINNSILVTLENADIYAKLAQAQASVEEENAKLDGLIIGTREEEIVVQNAQVNNKRVLFEEAKRNIVNVINDTFTKSDDAIRNEVDQFIDNPRSARPSIAFSTTNRQQESEVESGRVNMEDLLVSWSISLETLSEDSEFDEYANTANLNISLVKSFLDIVSLVINDASVSVDLSQTTIDGYKDDVSTARTNINTAINNLATAQEELKDAATALVLEEEELSLKLAGSTTETITAQEAVLSKAKALVMQYEAELAKTILRSPFSGVVSKQDIDVGETATAGDPVVSLISLKKFKVEANIPEVDITQVEINDIADVTLDAYGDDVPFVMTVVSVEPAATIIEGVPTYKTTFMFQEEDKKILSGMTTDITIVTDTRENVISVPHRAILTDENGENFVRMLTDFGVQENIPVEPGLRGSSGMTEIVEGVQEGDKIIIFIKQ
jgi:RND family efflux transporter MFP subunit